MTRSPGGRATRPFFREDDMRKTLFEIGSELLALDAFLDEVAPGGEIPPEAEEKLTAWMATLAADEGAKLDAYVNLVRQLEMEADAAQKMVSAWKAKVVAKSARALWLVNNLRLHLERTNRRKVETAAGVTIAVRANGGAAPVVVDPNVNFLDIPERFVKIERRVDVAAVRAALEAGEDLAFARLDGRGSHVRIS